jgi:ribosomal protein L16 Arg81 hydroxylase
VSLQSILAPVEPPEFLRAYWENIPLHVNRSQPDFYLGLISLNDINCILTERSLIYPAVRLVREGEYLPVGAYADDYRYGFEYIEGVVDPLRVVDEFSKGATIVFNALDRHWRSLSDLCRELENQFKGVAHANGYLSPKRAVGFAPHYDTHEVFVLQITGTKRWKVYDPVIRLPLPSQVEELPSELGEPAYEIELDGGDLLYLPRGYIHSAVTSSEVSFHVTIGLTPYTWVDAFREAVRLCENELRFRHSFPLASPDGTDDERSAFQEFGEMLQQDRTLAAVRELLLNQFISNCPPTHRGGLDAALRLEEVTARSVVQLDPATSVCLTTEESGVALRCNGQKIKFPEKAREALTFAEKARTFTVDCLPGLGGEDKLAFVRRLIRKGVLTVLSYES